MWKKLKNQVQKELCPFCFEYFYLRDAPFRCTNVNKKCPPEIDIKYQDAWNDSQLRGKVIDPTVGFRGVFANSVKCDCGQKTHKRLCPHCHSDLPHTIGHNKNYIFAVIGAKDAGKSHYLAVLINLLRKNLLGLNIGISPINDSTITRYARDFYDRVFEKGITILTTQSGKAEINQPLVYSLTITGKGILDDNVIKKAITLVFFDTAGEDLNDQDVMSTVNKYIYRSSGVILLIDPLQISNVRSQISENTELPSMNTDSADILSRTISLIEKGQQLSPTEKIKIPLAISFSKFDAVLPLIDSQAQLQAVANHEQGFDEDDFEAINSEMMSLLEQWNGQDIIRLAQSRFKEYGFFGLSALGCNPHGTNKIASVIPQRVEDPFLWLLFKNKIIKKA